MSTTEADQSRAAGPLDQAGANGDEAGSGKRNPASDAPQATNPLPVPRLRPPARSVPWWKLCLALLLVGLSAYGYWYWNHPAHRYQLALAALRSNDFEQLQYEMAMLDHYPQYGPHFSLLEGAILLKGGQPAEALRILAYTAQHADTAIDGAILAARALYSRGDFRKAEQTWHQVLSQRPRDADTHRCLASAYYDLGMMSHASTHLDEVAKLDPADPRPHRLLGLMHKDFGHHQDAIEAYQESLGRSTKQPDLNDIYWELADCYHQLRDQEQALEVLSKCEATPDVLVLQAACYFSLKDGEQSRRCLKAALQQDPQNLLGLQLRASLYLDARKPEEAAKILAKGVQYHPKDYTMHYQLLQAYQMLGASAEAEAQVPKVRTLNELQTKFQTLHDQVVQKPRDAQVRYELGDICAKLNMMDLAKSWYRAALGLDPDHVQAQSALAQLLGGSDQQAGIVPRRSENLIRADLMRRSESFSANPPRQPAAGTPSSRRMELEP